MAIKAIITDLTPVLGQDSYEYKASFINDSNDSLFDTNTDTISLLTDISDYTPDQFRNAITTKVLAYATNQSYGTTADDILWSVPGLLTASEVTTIKNATQARSFATASRTLNSAFQISSTRDTVVSYSVDIAASATLLGGQTGTVFLEYANDSGFTSGVTEVARFVNGNSVSLAIAITLTQNVTGTLTGMIPAGKYVRIRTANTTGTPTFTYRSGQEVLI